MGSKLIRRDLEYFHLIKWCVKKIKNIIKYWIHRLIFKGFSHKNVTYEDV